MTSLKSAQCATRREPSAVSFDSKETAFHGFNASIPEAKLLQELRNDKWIQTIPSYTRAYQILSPDETAWKYCRRKNLKS